MLNVISLSEAKRITEEKMSFAVKTQTVPLSQAAGRVLAENIVADADIPAFDRSTVDGFAVIASDSFGAGESIPAIFENAGEVLMGASADFTLLNGQCAKISTGGMLPRGADAVIMVEYTDTDGDECLAYRSVSPFENVTRRGDEVRAGQTVIPAKTLLTPFHTGLLAAMGKTAVTVLDRPKVRIISTGDEIVPVQEVPLPGQIRDVNTHLLAAALENWGCACEKRGIVKDDFDKIYEEVKNAAENCDILLISGGSSAGARDMTADIIGRLGQVYAHGIAVKPGKPTILGRIGGTAVFGLPGHPAAAYFVALALVRPLIAAAFGRAVAEKTVEMPLKSSVSSNAGREEFICVREENGFAVPVYAKSGIISLLSRSLGYITVDRNAEGIAAGTVVSVRLFT